jgi:hypothetical protein
MFKLYAIMLAPSVKAMNGNRGRMVVQASHAFVHSLWDAERRYPETVIAYRAQASAFKIALVTDSEKLLRDLATKYGELCGCSLVEETGSKATGDVNHAVAMVTALGLGPLHVDLIGEDLALLRNFL